MAKKKTSSKAKTKKQPAGGTFYDVLQGLSRYERESKIKLKGRGSYAKKAKEIYSDIKGQPGWQENLDIIIPQYLEEVIPRDDYEKELQQFIEDEAFEIFDWWHSSSNFHQLMESEIWRNTNIVLIYDDLGNSKYYKDPDTYDTSLYSTLKFDYRDDKFIPPDYPLFRFYGIYKKNKNTIIKYQLENWDLTGYDETLQDILKQESERIKEKEIKKIEDKKLPEEKEADARLEIEKEKLRLESERKQKSFEYERKQLQEEFKEGLWTKDEYREELNNLRKTYGLI